MTQSVSPISLYDRDLNLWLEQAIGQLKAKDFECLDVENLIEELEGLAGRDRREVKRRLQTLLEHLLKRLYVKMPREYNGWERTIREQQKELDLLFEDSPSLKILFTEAFEQSYQKALKEVRQDYSKTLFPEAWELSQDLDIFLNMRF